MNPSEADDTANQLMAILDVRAQHQLMTTKTLGDILLC